jgi:hypothetical protein
MRLGILLFFGALLLAMPAAAQTSITLNADPVPIINAEINGRPVRLEVDTRFPRGIALSTAAAERLRVRRVPFLAIAIGIEGSDATMRGRLARPRVTFPGGAELDTESTRAFAGIFPAPVSTRADGVIGPGALPYDVVTITLGPDQPDARDITFQIGEDDELWAPQVEVGGQSLRVLFAMSERASIINRPATRVFDGAGSITSVGEVVPMPFMLGLNTLMQPVETSLAMQGLPLAPAYARTNAPLLGAVEEDAFVVSAEDRNWPPSLIVGRAALSRCSSISVDRRARQMTLRCAA